MFFFMKQTKIHIAIGFLTSFNVNMFDIFVFFYPYIYRYGKDNVYHGNFQFQWFGFSVMEWV